MRFVLNSAVITSEGLYRYHHMSPEDAAAWCKAGEFVSAIGYQETSDVLSELVGVAVPVNRVTIKMEPGDQALVFRVVLPPGSNRIAPGDKGQIGEIILKKQFELGLLERIS